MRVSCKNENFGDILICAVRYAMPRQTYISSVVTDFITPLLPELTDRTLFVLERDIKREKERGRGFLGDEMIDKPLWLDFLKAVQNERKKRTTNEQAEGVASNCRGKRDIQEGLPGEQKGNMEWKGERI